ncbi:hypothetical protein FDECE_12126 [Fusarium decemcellulare]|nr:hypothetical protein FDECE_12126 [Fusarium decemcellulare]
MDGFADIPEGARVRPKPYTFNVPEQSIAEFKQLLQLSKIGPKTWESGSSKFGITRDWLIHAKDTWLNHFDWRAYEQRINAFPNFKTVVTDPVHGDMGIHFVALFSKRADALPIMFLHGWPGSFQEFQSLLGLLTDKYTPATLPYHVIVPSLPGYALSDGPPLDNDFSLEDVARIVNQLMIDLGFGARGYVAQGGDVGSAVSRLLAASQECKAIHLNLMSAPEEEPSGVGKVTAEEAAHVEKAKKWRQSGMAYAMEHKTRPGTIGLALSSSPLALLAWIGEKYLEWVDQRKPLQLGTILGLVSLYWFTDTFPRCLYPYRALWDSKYPDLGATVLGYSYFPAEITGLPAAWGKVLYPNMIRYDHNEGGHFAALEEPRLLLADVEDFMNECRRLVL